MGYNSPMIICMVGRQPHIGLAELEAVFGASRVQPLGNEAALVDTDKAAVTHSLLGGAIKIGEVLTVLNTTTWQRAVAESQSFLLSYLENLPEGKVTLGLSAYGLHCNSRQLERASLELKKMIKATGRPARIVPTTDLTLNSAQVWHNNLTGDLGIELLLVADRGRTYLARTFSVQNVDAYSQRDFGRPKRDARVGMLPPKLAQIMLNLAGVDHIATVLDPFCGTGVVLMEAALHGSKLLGSDLNATMIDYTRDNLAWLGKTYRIAPDVRELQVGDATTYRWQMAPTAVVTETYLGRPLTALPDPQTLQTIVRDCNTIISAFLRNLLPQLAPDARCCIAVPAWKTAHGFIHLPLVDDLKKMGYNRISFSYARSSDLVYHRPDQIVARELLVLTSKKDT